MESPPSLSGSETDSTSSQLTEYIPLGCLVFFLEDTNDNYDGLQWIDVTDPNSFSSLLPAEVIRLAIAEWVYLRHATHGKTIYFRIYLLPDDVRQSTLERQSKALRSDLGYLCAHLDTSIEAWSGRPSVTKYAKFDLWSTGVHRSLFWLFNSLPSPSAQTDDIPKRHSRLAAETVLANHAPSVPATPGGVNDTEFFDEIHGLKAKLYGYQAKSVAEMIRREALPRINLDPRFEERRSPTGSKYYYNSRNLTFRHAPPQYEGIRGGILAETMGVGKTVMIIALILATRFHLPTIPPEYSTSVQKRLKVGRLTDMAIAQAGKFGIPLKSHLHVHRHAEFPHLETRIDVSPTFYEVPYVMRRSIRKNSSVPPPRRLRLCSTSIIVVPRNLLRQWQSELHKHAIVGHGGLRILVLDKSKDSLPCAEEIASYDILLFSKSRFELEARDGMDDKGRSLSNVRAECLCPYIGATRIKDCSCLRPDGLYHTPLKDLHFLRIVIDEGHEFSSQSSNAVMVATSLITVERRWIVSGTPAKDRLVGVDVELSGNTVLDGDEAEHVAERQVGRISNALKNRKSFVRDEELNGASKPLGMLLSHFLQVRPWAGTDTERKVEWEDFAFRHESLKGRTHTAFSQCMVSTLNALVIKTRPEDLAADVVLPPMYTSVKMLSPSFYDIVTLNLFNFVITANAITSERTDVDYLFHPNSAAARHSLVKNLRASSFFWTGWSESDILGAIGHSERYLAKETAICSDTDRRDLTAHIDFAKKILKSKGWKAMSQTHELALYVRDWPDEQCSSWSLNYESDPMMVGATQLHVAQKFMNVRLFDENPIENLAALGNSERERAFTVEEQERKTKQKEASQGKMGVPAGALREKQFDSRQHALPKKKPRKNPNRTALPAPDKQSDDEPSMVSPNKRKRSDKMDTRELPDDSSLAKSRVIGTVSSKLSYLLGRVMELNAEEKIIIFYDSDNSAWYISQVLDLFHVKHLIYARGITQEQKSKYIVAFDTDNSIRVLLMNISQGAYGLNVNKASRVFFLNPPLTPHGEAQAIKRAHRIGQTRPVYVETLVLRGTVEEAMWRRSQQMTREEHESAAKEISNDSGIARIIQEAKSLPLPDVSGGEEMMAPLSEPLQVFGRKGRHDTKIKDIDAEKDESAQGPKKRRLKKKKLESAEQTSTIAVGATLNDDLRITEQESIFGRALS